MIIASSSTQQHIELFTTEQNGGIRKLLSPPIYHSSYHQKHNELPPFCSAAHAFSKTALAWHYCTYLNAEIGQGSKNIQFSHTVVTVCHKVKEEMGCKSTPLAENVTSFLLFFWVINAKSCVWDFHAQHIWDSQTQTTCWPLLKTVSCKRFLPSSYNDGRFMTYTIQRLQEKNKIKKK